LRRGGIPLFTFFIIAAAAVLIAGIYTGQLEIYFFLIFPVIYGNGAYALLAFVLIIAAFISSFLSIVSMPDVPARTGEIQEEGSTFREDNVTRSEGSNERKRAGTFGGVILIGPVPIVFGSDRRIAWYMLLVALAITLFLAYFFLSGYL